MVYIWIEDKQRCNFCEYWSGKRTESENFVWIDFDTAEWGLCRNKEHWAYDMPRASCEGCSKCKLASQFRMSDLLSVKRWLAGLYINSRETKNKK